MFPHHENEIAQSEGAFGQGFVNVWIHNGFVQINQEKMSKSLGNFLTVKDILKQYHPEVVRLFLLSNHYRSPVDFTEQAMADAEAGLEKIYALLQRVSRSTGGDAPDQDQQRPGDLWVGFCEAMDDDFNTARAIGLIFDTVRGLNRVMDDMEERGTSETWARLESGRGDLMRVGAVLGIGTEAPSHFFAQKKAKAVESEAIDEALVESLIAERLQAREQKDWERADQIRSELSAMNIVLEDRPEGTTWKLKT